ncbi:MULTISPECIES: hypothetical protein [unclassified Agrococcus]|uniref:hypothetical protein n=1 Tax=unclassified Agrococcus TaxID=2615065 RepID=UPI003616A1C9
MHELHWRRRLWRDLIAWIAPCLGYLIVVILSMIGWVSFGEVTWLALSWSIGAWLLVGTWRVARTLRERPEDRER